MRYVLFIMTALFIFAGFFTHIYGDTTTSPSPPASPLITTSTDKPSYLQGDTILIEGAVKSVFEQTPLTIQIFDPNNNLVQVKQIDVSKDGKYTTTIKASGILWKANGIYTVKVQYGPPNVTAQATFTFQATLIPISNTFQLKDPTSQQTFNINYTISGSTLKDMTLDEQSLSLGVSLNSSGDGTITLQLPRILIDAKTNSGQDDPFIILIDGAEVKPNSESANSDFRNITIQTFQGDKEIEIIGTQIIPEFGPIAALVLAIAIISIIAVSAKTGLRLMPKY